MNITVATLKVAGIGQVLLMPVCDKAKLFAAIAATSNGSIPHETLGHIAQLGYEVIMQAEK